MDLCSNSTYNHRNWSDPVDYPDISPRRYHVALKDLNRGIVWFEAIVPSEVLHRLRRTLWNELLKDLRNVTNP